MSWKGLEKLTEPNYKRTLNFWRTNLENTSLRYKGYLLQSELNVFAQSACVTGDALSQFVKNLLVWSLKKTISYVKMKWENYCDFIAGCFGGACGVFVGHPLDTIKTWQQTSNSSVFTAMRLIHHRNNGVCGGMFFPFVTTGAVNSILFGVYGNHLRQLRKVCHSDYQREQLEYRHMFIAGSIAGFVQSFIACPIELIKVRLQTHNYYNEYVRGRRRTAFKLFLRILKFDGISGLYRGLLPMMCRDVFPYGIYMLTYRVTMDYLEKTDFMKRRKQQALKDSKVDGIVTTLAGAFAGILSWVCVIPFDVVKTIMQAEENRKYKNIRHCIEMNVRRYGWRSLFRGSWMLVVRAVPVNAATFLGYEYALEVCHRGISIKP